VDLTDANDSCRATLADKCRALGLPYSSSRPKLKQLHDTIAFHCENLSELRVNIDIPEEAIKTKTDIQDHVSKTLFSPHCTYKKLDLKLSMEFGLSSVLEAVLENLVDLEELTIRCFCPQSGRQRRIHMASKKLRSLDVTNLPKGTWISGDLPNLTTLIYRGFMSGIAPRFIDGEEPEDAWSQSFTSVFHSRFRFRAGQVTIHNLNIPPACLIFAQMPCFDYELECFRNAALC